MALTDLQKRIMRRLSQNRSESSYLAGGIILNLDWPRRSDDIDIFHDTDEEVSIAAKKDIADLETAGFRVTVATATQTEQHVAGQRCRECGIHTAKEPDRTSFAVPCYRDDPTEDAQPNG